jgi:perosamine synthetase
MTMQTDEWRSYPTPVLPSHPVLRFGELCRDEAIEPSILDVGTHVFTTSGRVAIAHALQLLSCTSEHEVLLPAYHCAAMRTPIEWLGARPRFYRLHPDLSVDLEDVKTRIGPKTHSLIMAHFFGFPQDIGVVRQLCHAHGVYLIEDCAHAFFGRVHGEPVGSFGDYAIASTMKFFPSFDGGVLASRTHTINGIDWRNGGMRFAIKASVNMLERAAKYGRLRPLDSVLCAGSTAVGWLRSYGATATKVRGASRGPQAAEGSAGFDPEWMHVRMSWPSVLAMRATSWSHIIAGRRRNYQWLAERVEGLQGVRVVSPGLEEHVVPYVVPLLFDSWSAAFESLKTRGVPLFRWEDVPGGICDVSTRYSWQLFQIPCHEGLRQEELDWLYQCIRKAGAM